VTGAGGGKSGRAEEGCEGFPNSHFFLYKVKNLRPRDESQPVRVGRQGANLQRPVSGNREGVIYPQTLAHASLHLLRERHEACAVSDAVLLTNAQVRALWKSPRSRSRSFGVRVRVVEFFVVSDNVSVAVLVTNAQVKIFF
jgi:hypothetical protein